MNTINSDNLIALVKPVPHIDWLNVSVLFISVFLAAYLAYRFNQKHEKNKIKQQISNDYSILSHQIVFLLYNLLDYKKQCLDRIKDAYEKNDKNIPNLYILMSSKMSFHIDLDKYFFMTAYNRCFLTEFQEIQKTSEFLQSVIQAYNQNLTQANMYETSKQIFFKFYKDYELFCIKTYYINKQFSKCYEKFFNIFYLENLQDTFKKDVDITKYIPDALKNKDFIEWEKGFDKYWQNKQNFWHWIALQRHKIKCKVKFIYIFFSIPKGKKL